MFSYLKFIIMFGSKIVPAKLGSIAQIYLKWFNQVTASLGCIAQCRWHVSLTWYIPICRSACHRSRVRSEEQWQMFIVSLEILWHFRYAFIEISSWILLTPPIPGDYLKYDVITYWVANTRFRSFHLTSFPRPWKRGFSRQYPRWIPGL